MEPRSCRLYVHDSWPRWLAVLLGLLALTVVALYFAAPDVPKLPAIPFLALLGFLVFASHRASQSWVEVSSDGKAISAIPSWYARSLAGESVITQTILPTAELVLCRNTAYDSFDGFSAILRGPGGSEQTVWKGMRGMDYRRCLGFSKEMQQRFGLPVRLLYRRVTERGVEESEWTPGTGKINSKAMAFGLAMFLLPWVGIVVRVSTPNYRHRRWAGPFLCGRSNLRHSTWRLFLSLAHCLSTDKCVPANFRHHRSSKIVSHHLLAFPFRVSW